MAAPVGLDRERVVAAAADLVDTEGIEALTFARLAERLGVRYQSLYSHVGSPDGLQRELQRKYCVEFRDVTQRAAIGLARREALHAIAIAAWRYALAHPGLAAVHLRRGTGDPELREVFEDTSTALLTVLRTYGLSETEVLHWRRAFSVLTLGFATLENAQTLRPSPPVQGTITRIVDSFADTLDALAAARRRAG